MTSSSLFASCRAIFVAALLTAGFLACGGGASEPATDTADSGAVDVSSTIPEGSRPSNDNAPNGSSTTSKSDAGDAGPADASSTSAKDASSDASSDAATPNAKDAQADASPAAKLPYGSTCTTHGECAGSLCLEFDGKLRCTKTCKKDSDCQNGDDCDDDIKVCEID